jgi:signal transduction histidine kinase
MTRKPARSVDAELVIAASKADARQHVLTGLLHDLNGPLNNLGLTLALLERALAPWLVAHAADETTERVRRYMASLAADASRLGSWSRATSATVHPSTAAEPATLAQLLEEVHRLLRHHATLAEVRLAVDAARGGDARVEDARAASAALLSLVVAAVSLARTGGAVTVASDADASKAIVRIAVQPARRTSAVAKALASTPGTPSSTTEMHLLAGRLQVESLRGTATTSIDDERVAIDVTLPAAPASSTDRGES